MGLVGGFKVLELDKLKFEIYNKIESIDVQLKQNLKLIKKYAKRKEYDVQYILFLKKEQSVFLGQKCILIEILSLIEQ